MSTDFDQPLVLSMATEGDTTVIGMDGELDPHTAPLLEDAVKEAVSNGAEKVVLDLSQLRFIDSSGLRAVIGSHQELSNQGRQLVLRKPNEIADRLLTVTNLRSHLTVED